ncbi:MAG TPA: hypothetical protein VIT65_27535 [Microlunatus sp.]
MILSELIGSPVVQGGDRVGLVADLRFVLDAASDSDDDTRLSMPDARLYGILVSPRAPASFLGYERSGVTKPWPLAQLLRRRERGSFLVLWADVGQLSADGVLLRPQARRWSPALAGSLTRRARERQG